MARDEMRLERMRLREQLISDGGASLDARERFATRIIEFLDELRENEEKLGDGSDVGSLSETKAAKLERLSWEQETVKESLNRANNASVEKTVPAVATASPRVLIDASLQLDKVANKLGLGTPALRTRPHNHMRWDED